MVPDLHLPPPDEMPDESDAFTLPAQQEPLKPSKTRSKAKTTAADDAAPIDQSALNAAMQVLRAAGMEVVAKVGPKGPCPPDPDTGRQGYYQTTTDQNGRQHTVRVYSGFKEGEKGKRPDPVPATRGGR